MAEVATTTSLKGCVIWLTGLPSAGKSTISLALQEQLKARGERVEILDGDLVRENLSKGLGFSKDDRDINIRRIGFVANLLARNGVKVICAAISPYRQIRDEVRELADDFIEVYVSTPVEICEQRDVKGLYAKARIGEVNDLTGVDDPYEPPLSPEVTIGTVGESPGASAGKIVERLISDGYLA
ncbi:MAG: adenylyl-sulfate kinase [Actinomycetota bacterium]